MDVHN